MTLDRLMALLPPFDFGRLVNMLTEGAILLVGVWIGARLALRSDRQRVRHELEVRYAQELSAVVPKLLAAIEVAIETLDLAGQGFVEWHISRASADLYLHLQAFNELAQRGDAEASSLVAPGVRAAVVLAHHSTLLDQIDFGDDMLREPDPALPARLLESLRMLADELRSLRVVAVQAVRGEGR